MVEATSGVGAAPGVVRSADNVVHDLIAIANDVRRHIDRELAAAGYDHRRPGFAPLLSLVWRGGVPQGRLADALGVSPQAASQAVGLAVRAGFVARVPNPDDGRSKLVVLTDLGRSFVADGAAAITDRATGYAAILGPRRFARLDAALRRLRTGMRLVATDDPVTSLAPTTSIMAVAALADDALQFLHEVMRSAGHGRITAGQNLVLVYIGPTGARSSELARVQRVSRQAVSAVLHDLEAQRYVRRRDDAHDGRGVVFVPTAKGRRVLADYVAGIDELEARYASVLGPPRFEEMASAARDLARMVTLEHVHARAADRSPVADRPTDRRQGDLAEMGAELLRWLGPTDTWWLAAHLRQLVVDRVEPPAEPAETRGGR
jgi:DNA-binding MarR family transcriptional regulator